MPKHMSDKFIPDHCEIKDIYTRYEKRPAERGPCSLSNCYSSRYFTS